jgi:hypothetical protein
MVMLRRTAIRIVLMTLVTGVLLPTRAASAQGTNPFQDIPIVGSFLGGTFTGTLDIERFVARGGVLYAVGALSGSLTDAAGTVIGTITDIPIELPITNTFGSTCQVLHLELGPLDLDLLGLRVHLNRVVLDITAERGPGNLLGNLLCALASLLDANGSLTAITRLLNQILGSFA